MSIEIILTAIIVVIQFYIFLGTWHQVRLFQGVVPDVALIGVLKIYLTAEELNQTPPDVILSHVSNFRNPDRVMSGAPADFAEITLIESPQNENEVFKKILHSINTYLLRNRGAMSDFNLIKDITERNANAVEEEINLTISIPLFLGLMGTMLGIVIALFSMADVSQALKEAVEGEDTLAQGISILLGGVKIAMIASLVGLSLTTVNSGWFFKGSKSLVETNKNLFYTLIQTELLPVINQSLGSTFESLQRNLLKFNNEFTGNLDKLSGIFKLNFETLTLQESVLSKLEKLDVAKVAKYNINVLKELQTSVSNFDKFNAHFSNLNSSIKTSDALVERLNEVLLRTENFQTIAVNLEDKLTQSQALLDFLGQHFQMLETYKSHTTETLDTYKKQTVDSISDVGVSISDIFKELKEHIHSSSQKLADFTVDEIDLLKKALSESRTNLGNLQFLETINQDVSQFKDSAASQGERIRTLLQEVNGTLEKSIITLKNIEQSNNRQTRHQRGLTSYVKRLFGSDDE